jgi:hypothetical protein
MDEDDNGLLEGKFDGITYQHHFDFTRLTGQCERVYNLMTDQQWRTLREIESVTKDPQSSISARLRDLRKAKFGSHAVHRRSRGNRERGFFEYSLHRNGCTCDLCITTEQGGGI